MEAEPKQTLIKNLKTYPTTILLVDDQPIIADSIRSMLEGEEDVIFHYCSEPKKAIQIANEVHPTVILQDLIMPDMDGLTLLRYFLANPQTQNVPVIVLSTTEDPSIKAEAFSLGASDYIVKLPDKIEFLTRVRNQSEAYTRLLERNDAYAKLVENQVILNTDLQNAAAYVTSLLPLPVRNAEIEASWCFIPSAQLGGDAFGYYWLDDNNFIFFLLDVCGHGVGAALHSITVANVIRLHTTKDIDFDNPSLVLKQLNKMFPIEKHHDMFFTIWYGVYNKQTRLLKYSSAGHPAALLYDLNDSKLFKSSSLRTPGLVIGALSEADFINDSCYIPKDSRLFLFSDGAYTIKNSNNEMITIEDMIKTFDQYVGESRHNLEKIVRAFQQIQNGKRTFMDDFSIVEITFH